MSEEAWIGVDLDGTLAYYKGWNDEIGEPIQPMLIRVKQWLKEGKNVKIFTARVTEIWTHPPLSEEWLSAVTQREKIKAWCLNHIGQILEVTAVKDYLMTELWDDRAVQVISNEGTVK